MSTNCVATVNGKKIYSNKKLSSIQGSRIAFSDGSWCDVSTGEVMNNGAGYISIGTPKDDDSKVETSKSRLFPTNSLQIEDVNADIEIYVIQGDKMEVTSIGTKSDIDQIKINQYQDILKIEGCSKSQKYSQNSSITIVSGRQNICVNSGSGDIIRGLNIFSDNVNISSGDECDTKLKIGVPKGSSINVAKISGNTTIGDIEGPLQISMRSSYSAKVGKVGDSILSLQGSGDIEITSVNGAMLTACVQGSGDIKIHDGNIRMLQASVQGSGDIYFGGKTVEANLSIMGSGDIDIASSKHKPSRSNMGSGDINVRSIG